LQYAARFLQMWSKKFTRRRVPLHGIFETAA
jgi:hypothetical protein